MSRGRILVIFTGGTIGSYIHQGLKRVGSIEKTLDLVKTNVSNRGLEPICSNPLTKNSEEFNIDDWIKLLKSIYNLYTLGFRKILILHGTDTIHYSCALLDFFAPKDMSIVLSGSYYTLDEVENDVDINIQRAIDDLIVLDSGVSLSFASFDNHKAIKANLVKPMDYDKVYFEPLKLDFEVDGFLLDNDSFESINYKKEVFTIKIEPNVDYSLYSDILPKNSVVIFESYHSGTANSSEKILVDFIKNRDDITFILSLVFNNSIYKSTQNLIDLGVLVSRKFLPHYLYTVFTISKVLNLDELDIKKRLDLTKEQK